MGEKKRFRLQQNEQKPGQKNMILISLVLLLVCAAAIPTLAWLTAQSQVKNEFILGETSVEVKEEFDGTIKKNVFVENSGNVPVYIRAAVSVYWKDEEGKLLKESPTAGDYTIGWNLDDGWVKGSDDLYYYIYPVTDKTSNLIDTASQEKQYDDGRILYVDIIAQSIQAEPSDAVLEAWKSSVDGVESTRKLQITAESAGMGDTGQEGGNAG